MESLKCIIFKVDPIIANFGPLTLRWYGLLFVIGLYIGHLILNWQFNRAHHEKDMATRFTFYLFVGLIIGAFLGHRIFYDWQRFISDPLSTFSFKGGIQGLSSHGAAIGVLVASLLFHFRTKIRYLELLDRLVMPTCIIASFVRWGNLMNSEIVGRETTAPWAFCFPLSDHGAYIPRHPSQIYEIITGLVSFLVLFIVDKKLHGEKRPLGVLTAIFAIVFFSLRFFAEFFKEYQALPKGHVLTMGQYLSIPLVISGIIILYYSLKIKVAAGIVPQLKVEKKKNVKKRKKRK